MRTKYAALTGAVLAAFIVVAADAAHQGRAARADRLSAIVGRVLDPSGEPAPFVRVTILWQRDRAADGSRLAYNISLIATTNNRGEYRLEGVAPGPYFVVAFPGNPPTTAASEPNRRGSGITYYPAARIVSDAKTVIVPPNGAVTANITLVSARIGEISGVAIGSDGRPVHGGHLQVAHGDGLFGLDSKGVVIGNDGRFRVLDVAPGTYFLQVREGVWPPPRDVIPSVSGARVELNDQDVSNVRVLPIRMVKATGRVIVDTTMRASPLLAQLTIGATPADPDGNPGPQRPGKIRSDLTFEFHTWPGLGYVSVLIQGGGSVLATERLDGVDVTDSGVNFKEGQDVTALEVTLANRPIRPSPRGRLPPP